VAHEPQKKPSGLDIGGNLDHVNVRVRVCVCHGHGQVGPSDTLQHLVGVNRNLFNSKDTAAAGSAPLAEVCAPLSAILVSINKEQPIRMNII